MHGCIAILSLLLAACGSSDGGDPLLDSGNPGGSTGSTLSIVGANGAASAKLEVEAGSLTSGFLATLANSSGTPIKGAFIALEPDQGFINAPPSKANSGGANSDASGKLAFAYQAPENITADTLVAIQGTATLDDGGKVAKAYQLTVTPPTTPVVTVTGKSEVAPGVANSGFSVTVRRGSGGQVPEACVKFAVSAGSVTAADASPCTDGSGGFLTDDAGSLAFSLTPAAGLSEDTAVVITASSTVSGKKGSGSFTTTAKADTFQFTAPAVGMPIVVGSAGRVPVQFQWTRFSTSGNKGVSGQVSLSSSSARLALDPSSSGVQSLTVGTSASSLGDFSQPVYVYGTAAGQSSIKAQDPGSGLSTTLSLLFVQSPSSINLDASPLQIPASPSSNRYSTLTVTVLNEAGQPISGVTVNFQLEKSISDSSNERVFPTIQTTDANGQAKSRYEAGTVTGSATVRVTIDGSTLNDSRVITVVAAT